MGSVSLQAAEMVVGCTQAFRASAGPRKMCRAVRLGHRRGTPFWPHESSTSPLFAFSPAGRLFTREWLLAHFSVFAANGAYNADVQVIEERPETLAGVYGCADLGRPIGTERQIGGVDSAP